MRRSRFVLDYLEGQVFDGWTRGNNWNGFAVPLFEFVVAQQIAEALHRNGQAAGYNQQLDAFWFASEDDEEVEFFAAIDVENHKLYPVGAGTWIWEESPDLTD